jgi:hypothetical protein
MKSEVSVRKPFVQPVVSEAVDALRATRMFGGQLGQVVLGGGSGGTAIDDGDAYSSSAYSSPDPIGQDCVDPGCGSDAA